MTFNLSLVVVWLVTPMLAFADNQTDDKEEKATKEKIAALIVQLGDSSFAKRVEAEKGLFEFGESALEQLSTAAKNTKEFEQVRNTVCTFATFGFCTLVILFSNAASLAG